jgi:hypothetical protein
MKKINLGGAIWAVTSYFNPMNGERRRLNYAVFRERLKIPLIAIEIGLNGRFDLSAADADILIQYPTSSVLWHKERALNIALRQVPPYVGCIAWLDCDIIFESDFWAQDAVLSLQTSPVVQLFSEMYDLDPGSTVTACKAKTPSFAYAYNRGLLTHVDFHPTAEYTGRAALGMAWAAKRELLVEHSLYDTLILGGGDRAIVCASIGDMDSAIQFACLNESRAEHFKRWAIPWFEGVKGQVGCIDGTLMHMWHGGLSKRKYVTRHMDLAKLEFDPISHLILDENQCWAWADDTSKIQDYAARYFASREEGPRIAEINRDVAGG